MYKVSNLRVNQFHQHSVVRFVLLIAKFTRIVTSVLVPLKNASDIDNFN